MRGRKRKTVLHNAVRKGCCCHKKSNPDDSRTKWAHDLFNEKLPSKGVSSHIWYDKGRGKTVCTSHVLAEFGIDACTYHYSGKRKQMIAILNRNKFSVRSRKSKMKGNSVGAARKAIRTLNDPVGTKYLLIVTYAGVGHALLLNNQGTTIVDTDPREVDRRNVLYLYAVYREHQ